MTKNSRIKFLIISTISIIVILFAIIIFQLVKIFQYNSQLTKLEKQIEKNNNIISGYEKILEESHNNSDEEIGVEQ